MHSKVDIARGIYTRLDVGSFNLFRGLVSGGFGDENANAWFGISADSHKGDRLQSKRASIRFHGNVGLKLSDTISTRFYASANALDQELPGSLTLAVARTAPHTATAINILNDYARDIDSLRLQNRTTFEFGDATLNVGLFLNGKELYHPIFQVVDQESVDKGGYFRLDWNGELFEVTLGGESRWGDIRSKRFVNSGGKRGALTFNADQDARTSTLYGEVRVKPIDNLTLVAGGIYADGVRKQQQIIPTAITAKASYNEFSPKFGVLWQPKADVQFFANYSRSAEFPTFVEVAQIAAFVPVKPQTAWTAEIGTRGKLGWASWDIALYRARLKGELLQFTVNPSIPAATFNADRTIHQGIEAGLSLEPVEWLRFRQIWQYSDFKFRGDAQYGNNRLPVIPTHSLRSEVRLGTDELHVSPNLEWLPKGAWADYANTVRAPGYTLFGLSAGYQLRDGIDLFLDARNITGKKAVGDVSAVIRANAASAIFYPVERTAVYGGVRARF